MSSEAPFVHLHCHSHYSMLDGASTIDRLVGRAKDHGMNALALTDHGNLHGALEFYRKAKAADINPIVGYEAYVAPGDRRSRESASLKDSSFHLTLLAQNATGFRNLVKMASSAYLEGFYRKPRIDRELLADHSEGIVCLSGCVSGELSRLLLKNQGSENAMGDALDLARWFHGVFGDRYFIEIQNNGIEIQRQAMELSIDVANKLGLPLVATSDAHYVDREDAEAQDVLLCINTGRFRTDTDRMKMEGSEFYLRPPEAMYEAFPNHADAVKRSQEIADTVDIELELGARHFPKFTLPKEKTAEELLLELCLKGLHDRYSDNEEMRPNGELSQAVMDRLDRELGVINSLGFANYFLICWDFVRESREVGIPTTARGSGVGAIVSYALYLSHVCPLKYDLLFERFLDPSRAEAPDIDIDFCKDRRGEIIRYVKDKYGEANVAQIGTFNTLAARQAIKDVGRALSIPLARVNEITQMVPEGPKVSLQMALDQNEELVAACKNDPDIAELIELAKRLEGLARNVGTHAAAVVIADKPLTEYVPLANVSGKTDVITQWSMNDVEDAGLLKMDFLGLRNLTILSKAVELIEQTTGEKIDPYKFPLDDKETFALLSRGETKGIFQLESGGIRDLLQKMKPDSFHDIIATNALYRPGPLEGGMVDKYVSVKNGRSAAEYKHPVLKEILEETHGVMVYQEQVMLILNRLGEIELAAAYSCIKAISKKKEEIINKNGEQFLAGATEKGLTKKEAEELWSMIQKFAGYGFNKSHSTAYALIAYMTAYLKCHHSVEFMAALLSGDIQGRNFKRKDALVEHMEDCQRMEIEVVPPDVNTSDSDFSVADDKIFFGLSAVKGCGGGAADAVVRARKADGPFKDIFDFCERIESSSCNRSTIETLIRAGAFDSMGAKRAQLSAVLDRALQSGASAAADRRAGQKSLFGDEPEEEVEEGVDLPDVPEWDDRERMLLERDVLGFYLSSHPLEEHRDTFSMYCSNNTGNLSDLQDRAEVTIGGMIGSIKTANVRKARDEHAATKYANFDLEDLEGAVRCIMWPGEYLRYGELIQPDAIVVARATVDRRGSVDEINLIINELIPLSEVSARYTRGIAVRIDEELHGPEALKLLHEISRAYPGTCEMQMILDLANGQRVKMAAHKTKVELVPEFKKRVEELLSADNVKILTSNGGRRRS